MGNKKDHAIRNQTLSHQLYNENTYYDWCVTTAFYSALQYVHLKILPQTYNSVNCSTLEEASIALNLPDKSKHYITEQLVDLQIPTIITEFRWLKDSSFNARYFDYEVNPANAKLALKFLKKIESVCIS